MFVKIIKNCFRNILICCR